MCVKAKCVCKVGGWRYGWVSSVLRGCCWGVPSIRTLSPPLFSPLYPWLDRLCWVNAAAIWSPVQRCQPLSWGGGGGTQKEGFWGDTSPPILLFSFKLSSYFSLSFANTTRTLSHMKELVKDWCLPFFPSMREGVAAPSDFPTHTILFPCSGEGGSAGR